MVLYVAGNKAKGRASKRVFQENKARQNFSKNEHFLPLIRIQLLFSISQQKYRRIRKPENKK